MLLVIDNYDSFTYNLVQYFGELGASMRVIKNDALGISDIEELNPSKICISPGPCTPNEAGISCAVIREFGGRVPILGVCLGHQAIAQVFGGEVVRANKLMHGKTSQIRHSEQSVFKGLPSPFIATRYHSLVVEESSLPACLTVTAKTVDEGVIMGLEHKQMAIHGVQFHPESILTEHGKTLLQNFLNL